MRRFKTVSCCRRARFSNTRSRREQKKRTGKVDRSLNRRSMRPVLHADRPNWIPIHIHDSTADRHFGEAQVLKESRQPVRVNGPRGTKTVTKLEAAMMQVGNKAAQGELRAAREFFQPVDRSEQAVSGESAPTVLEEADQRMMERILRRMQGIKPEAIDNSAETGEVSE